MWSGWEPLSSAGASLPARSPARQATTAYLDRIAALNPALEAYVTVTADRALTEAAARDAELAKGLPARPLHGVVYA